MWSSPTHALPAEQGDSCPHLIDRLIEGVPGRNRPSAMLQHRRPARSRILRPDPRREIRARGERCRRDHDAEALHRAGPWVQSSVDFLAADGDLGVSKTVGAALAIATTVGARVTDDAAFRARFDDVAARVLRAKQAASLLA